MIQKYEHNGKRLSLNQWAKEVGISSTTIRRRLDRGEDFATAITGKTRNYSRRCLEYKGEMYSYKELAKKFSMGERTLYSRIKILGMSVEDAVNTPIGKARRTNKDKCCYPDCDNCPYPDCVV